MTWGLAGTSEKLYRFIRTKSYEIIMEIAHIIRAFFEFNNKVKNCIDVVFQCKMHGSSSSLGLLLF